MSIKTKITFVVPESLQKEMRQQIISDEYGLRGKSKWISESILRFLELKNYIDLVQISEEMKGFAKTETISVDKQIKDALERAILEVRKANPSSEGVQSSIIRTSIVQRLLRS